MEVQPPSEEPPSTDGTGDPRTPAGCSRDDTPSPRTACEVGLAAVPGTPLQEVAEEAALGFLVHSESFHFTPFLRSNILSLGDSDQIQLQGIRVVSKVSLRGLLLTPTALLKSMWSFRQYHSQDPW